VYVVIRYGEKEVDPRESHADPESTKYAFWKEKTEAYITETEPDNREVIELARIVLSEGATKVSEPEDICQESRGSGTHEIGRYQ